MFHLRVAPVLQTTDNDTSRGDCEPRVPYVAEVAYVDKSWA